MLDSRVNEISSPNYLFSIFFLHFSPRLGIIYTPFVFFFWQSRKLIFYRWQGVKKGEKRVAKPRKSVIFSFSLEKRHFIPNEIRKCRKKKVLLVENIMKLQRLSQKKTLTPIGYSLEGCF